MRSVGHNSRTNVCVRPLSEYECISEITHTVKDGLGGGLGALVAG